jgi:hypothetical protein
MHRDALEDAGLDVEGLSRGTRPFAVGSVHDPNMYLPDPLSEDWVIESDHGVEPVQVLVAKRIRADVGVVTMSGQKRVLVIVRNIRADREATAVETSPIRRRIAASYANA